MKEIEEIKNKLEEHNYISNNQIDTTLFLAFALIIQIVLGFFNSFPIYNTNVILLPAYRPCTRQCFGWTAWKMPT